MTLYGERAGRRAGQIARCIRDGFAAADAGVRVKPEWSSNGLDGAGLRQWFRDKLDGMINLKAGLRSDGAPRRDRLSCRCRGCLHEHRHLMERGLDEYLRYASIRCWNCPRGHEDWGGRKWSDDYERGLVQDQWDLRGRSRVRQLRTPELRARFAHRIDD